MQVADLHCDLLEHLIKDPSRTAEDPKCRVSISQLLEGQVVWQTMAIFQKTHPGSAISGEKQFQAFKSLPKKYTAFAEKIRPILAIENASVFCEESEPLQKGLDRLERWAEEAGSILYITLTWNDENRFGGGNLSKIGLKPDGKVLLDWMNGKGISVDFSHTSDALAHDLLNTIDAKNYKIAPIASHSNFRKIADLPRNLSDEIAKEIILRKGLIGLNFLRRFLGGDGPEVFLRHLEHAEQLNGLDQLSFGADFFNDSDFAPEEWNLHQPFYYPHFDNASCYPRLLELLRSQLSKHQIENIASGNIFRFIKKLKN